MFSDRRSPWWLAGPVVLGFAVVSALGYAGLNGQDAHDYLRLSRAWTAWMHGAPMPHVFEHPHGYPMAGALLAVLTRSNGFALRLLSALALLIIVYTVRGVLRRAFPQERNVDRYVLLSVGLSPFLLRYGLMVMSDVPGMALLCVMYACTLRWMAEGHVRWVLGAIGAAVLAIGVRFACAPLAFLLGIALVHGPAHGRRARWTIAILLGVVGAVLLFTLLPMDQVRALVARSPIGDWSALDVFRRELRSDDGVLRYALPNCLYVLTIAVNPGFIPIGVLLLPFVRRADVRSPHAQLALVLVVAYLLFIAGMPFQNDRVLILVLPFLAVLLFPAFTRAWAFGVQKGMRPAWAMAALLTLQSALFLRAELPFIRQARTERSLAAAVNGMHPRRVYTHGMGAAFSDLCPSTQVTELWYTALDRFEPGALIVVQPANLAEQWEGHPPAINWHRAEAQGLDIVLQRPDGWTIARVR